MTTNHDWQQAKGALRLPPDVSAEQLAREARGETVNQPTTTTTYTRVETVEAWRWDGVQSADDFVASLPKAMRAFIMSCTRKDRRDYWIERYPEFGESYLLILTEDGDHTTLGPGNWLILSHDHDQFDTRSDAAFRAEFTPVEDTG